MSAASQIPRKTVTGIWFGVPALRRRSYTRSAIDRANRPGQGVRLFEPDAQRASGFLLLTFLLCRAWACVWLAGARQIPTLAAAANQPALVTLSIVGTSDLHGAAFPRNGLGGLPLLAGYVNNLRAARASDGGAVLLIDSGDTFQGDVESNLSEGALVVDAYNAMGYTAEAVGNHDFDFGSVDSPTARQLPGDLRGALKARAAQARYPFLAANLIDDATGRPVEWPNVRPSVLVEAAGIKVGIVGVMTIDALRSTLAANVQGLRIAPLGADDRRGGVEASRGRRRSRHRRGPCGRALRSIRSARRICRRATSESEIFQVARSLPHGLVDVIAAGHTHGGLAHQVDGIGIIAALLARPGVRPRRRRVRSDGPGASRGSSSFAPRQICARQDPATGNCVAATESAAPAQYEGRAVDARSGRSIQAMAPALQRVHALQATTLGVSLDAPIRRVGDARIAARKPLCRCAPRRGAGRGRCGPQQRGARAVGGPPGWPDHLRAALRRVPVRQSHRADHRERRRARPVAGRRDSAGPSRLAGHFRGRGAGRVVVADGLHVDLVRAAGRDSR